MTKQEYYNKLVKCASDGTFPSGGEGGCWYRNGPHQCAVGILIPESMYLSAFEGLPVDCLFVNEKLPYDLIPESMTLSDLLNLQNVHDTNAREGWNSNKFIQSINIAGCFQDVVQVLSQSEEDEINNRIWETHDAISHPRLNGG
jgi:hypothetical protein